MQGESEQNMANAMARETLLAPPKTPEEVLVSLRKTAVDALQDIYGWNLQHTDGEDSDDIVHRMLGARDNVYNALTREGIARYETAQGPAPYNPYSLAPPRVEFKGNPLGEDAVGLRGIQIMYLHGDGLPERLSIGVVWEELRETKGGADLWVHSLFLYPEDEAVITHQKFFEYTLTLKGSSPQGE